MIAVFAQREAAEDDPPQEDLHPVGTASHIHKMFKLPDGSLRIIVQGVARVRLDEMTATRPYLRAVSPKCRKCSATRTDSRSTRSQRNIKTNFQQIVSLSPLMSDDLQTLASTSPSRAGSPTSSPPASAPSAPTPSRRCCRRSTSAPGSTC